MAGKSLPPHPATAVRLEGAIFSCLLMPRIVIETPQKQVLTWHGGSPWEGSGDPCLSYSRSPWLGGGHSGFWKITSGGVSLSRRSYKRQQLPCLLTDSLADSLWGRPGVMLWAVPWRGSWGQGHEGGHWPRSTQWVWEQTLPPGSVETKAAPVLPQRIQLSCTGFPTQKL